MELNAGDMLAVQFVTVKGSFEEPDESILHAGNGNNVTEFPRKYPPKAVQIPSMWKRITPEERFTFIKQAERMRRGTDHSALEPTVQEEMK